MRIGRDTYHKRMAAFREACRQKGFRITPQRLAVFSELSRALDHPSAETIHKRVRKRLPTITLDTVYRTLGTLEKVGLVVRVCAVGTSMRFEANIERHHHFLCRECGSVLDVYSDKLDRLSLDPDLPVGYRVDWSQVQLRGVCARCAGHVRTRVP